MLNHSAKFGGEENDQQLELASLGPAPAIDESNKDQASSVQLGEEDPEMEQVGSKSKVMFPDDCKAQTAKFGQMHLPVDALWRESQVSDFSPGVRRFEDSPGQVRLLNNGSTSDRLFGQALIERKSMPASDLKTYLSSQVTTRDTCGSRFVISSSNVLYQGWKVSLIALSFLSSLFYAYYAVFLDKKEGILADRFERIDSVIGYIFAVDLILHFFEEYHYPISQEVERDLRKLALLYLRGRFVLDIVTIIPLYSFATRVWEARHAKVVYLVKLLRLYNGFQMLNYKTFMAQIKNVYMARIQAVIKKDAGRAECQTTDQTKITQILLISKFIKITQLIVVILCLSFLTGLLWYLICDLLLPPEEANFIQVFGLDSQSSQEGLATMTYFAFTTISTVGLGDLHPQSSYERSLCIFVMLFGVLATSYVMENLNLIIQELRDCNKPFEESQPLNLFFGTIRRFNSSVPLKAKLQEEIETYFDQRWSRDSNLAVATPEDAHLFEQLPKAIQGQIFTEFLFKNFLKEQKAVFQLSQADSSMYLKLCRLLRAKFPEAVVQQFFFQQKSQLGGEVYQDFIISILKVLEPLWIGPKGTVLKQNSFPSEIIFLTSGLIEVGYNFEYFLYETGFHEMTEVGDFKKKLIQKKLKSESSEVTPKYNNELLFPVTLTPGVLAVGLFEMAYGKRAQFIYRAKESSVKSLFVRKQKWVKIISSSERRAATYEDFKGSQVINSYLRAIYLPIKKHQSSTLKQRLKAEKQMNRQETEEIQARIGQRISRMMGDTRAKQLELQVLIKSKRKFIGSNSSSSSSSSNPKDIRIATEEVVESSNEPSSESRGSRNEDSLEASYESEDSFSADAKKHIEETGLAVNEKKKLRVVQGRIKKMMEMPHYSKGQSKLMQVLKEDFYRSLACLRVEQELKEKQAKKQVKSAKEMEKAVDPIVELFQSFSEVLEGTQFKWKKGTFTFRSSDFNTGVSDISDLQDIVLDRLDSVFVVFKKLIMELANTKSQLRWTMEQLNRSEYMVEELYEQLARAEYSQHREQHEEVVENKNSGEHRIDEEPSSSSEPSDKKPRDLVKSQKSLLSVLSVGDDASAPFVEKKISMMNPTGKQNLSINCAVTSTNLLSLEGSSDHEWGGTPYLGAPGRADNSFASMALTKEAELEIEPTEDPKEPLHLRSSSDEGGDLEAEQSSTQRIQKPGEDHLNTSIDTTSSKRKAKPNEISVTQLEVQSAHLLSQEALNIQREKNSSFKSSHSSIRLGPIGDGLSKRAVRMIDSYSNALKPKDLPKAPIVIRQSHTSSHWSVETERLPQSHKINPKQAVYPPRDSIKRGQTQLPPAPRAPSSVVGSSISNEKVALNLQYRKEGSLKSIPREREALDEVPESPGEHHEIAHSLSITNSMSRIEESLPEESKRLEVVSRHSHFGNKSHKSRLSKFQEQQSIDEEIDIQDDPQMTEKWERESTGEVSEQKSINEEIDWTKRQGSINSNQEQAKVNESERKLLGDEEGDGEWSFRQKQQ